MDPLDILSNYVISPTSFLNATTITPILGGIDSDGVTETKERQTSLSSVETAFQAEIAAYNQELLYQTQAVVGCQADRSPEEVALGSNASDDKLRKETLKKTRRTERYHNATEEAKARRRAQNRQSQKLYRERKDQRIADLERQVAEMTQEYGILSAAYDVLKQEYYALCLGSICCS